MIRFFLADGLLGGGWQCSLLIYYDVFVIYIFDQKRNKSNYII
jgi:hypothetical protein